MAFRVPRPPAPATSPGGGQHVGARGPGEHKHQRGIPATEHVEKANHLGGLGRARNHEPRSEHQPGHERDQRRPYGSCDPRVSQPNSVAVTIPVAKRTYGCKRPLGKAGHSRHGAGAAISKARAEAWQAGDDDGKYGAISRREGLWQQGNPGKARQHEAGHKVVRQPESGAGGTRPPTMPLIPTTRPLKASRMVADGPINAPPSKAMT